MTDPTKSPSRGFDPVARYPVRWKSFAIYAWGPLVCLWFFVHWLAEVWVPSADVWMDRAQPWFLLLVLPSMLTLALSMKCHNCGYRWPLHHVREPKPTGCLRCGSSDWGLGPDDDLNESEML